MDREIAERLLERAAVKQTEFWEALKELEDEMDGADIESTQDLSNLDLDTLIELCEEDA